MDGTISSDSGRVILICFAVLPEGWYPSQAVEANKWYIDTYKDPLVMPARLRIAPV